MLFFPTTVYAADIKNAEPAAMTGEKTEPTSATDEKSESTVKLTIDNQNRYEGMNSSYSDGYVPRVENGQAWLVVPLKGQPAPGIPESGRFRICPVCRKKL